MLLSVEALSLGMKTAGAFVQRIMDMFMGDLQPLSLLVYIDDITVYSSSFQQHVVDLDVGFPNSWLTSK